MPVERPLGNRVRTILGCQVVGGHLAAGVPELAR